YNFILISMLRSAGFNANPILLSTRDKAINLFPSRTAYNYVICGVEVENKIIFLDATEKYATFNILPMRCRNYLGRIIRKSGSSAEVDLASKTISKNMILCNAIVNKDGKIEGNIKDINSATNAYLFRNENLSLSKDSYIEKKEKNNPGLEIQEYNLFNRENLEEDIKEEYDFVHSNQVETIDGKLYFKPLLFFALEENPFKSENRTYPIDFIFPTNDSFTFTFTIPDGFEIESIPSNISISMVDNISNFKFLAGKVANKIQIVCNFNKNETFILADYYEDLKAFYNQVYLKMNEKIILKKQ
ncbi:MAG: transglutaminase, partial [Flavobacterium sp.]